MMRLENQIRDLSRELIGTVREAGGGDLHDALAVAVAADPSIVTTEPRYVRLIGSGTGVALSTVSAADMPTGGTVQISCTITYQA